MFPDVRKLMCFFCLRLYSFLIFLAVLKRFFMVKENVLSVAKRVIPDFVSEKDMEQSLYNLGLDSLGKLSMLMDVEIKCRISFPPMLAEKVNTVGDIVVAVENLKAVKKRNDTWVPCAFSSFQQCGFMSEVSGNTAFRSTISPDSRLCERVACRLYTKHR